MGKLRKRIGELTLLVPGDPGTLTGGYIYDRHIDEGLRRIGWHVDLRSLDDSFPHPTANALDHAREVLRNIPDRRLVVIDGLALGGLSGLLQAETTRLRFVALIHHPLALETGLDETVRRNLRQSECDSLVFVPRIIVTSKWTSRALADYGVAEDRISVVEPGVDIVTSARRAGFDGRATSSLTLLSVATLTPRKGHSILFDALARIRDRNWRLHCVGSVSRDPATAEALRQQIERLRLSERICLLGEVDATTLHREYDCADVFVHASYLEGYGMALAEAVGHGLPIVSTAAGAIPLTVSSKVGLLVPAGNASALAEAIAKVLDEPDTRQQLAINALAARKELPTWELSCKRFAAALEKPW